jgi:hypothetical protein
MVNQEIFYALSGELNATKASPMGVGMDFHIINFVYRKEMKAHAPCHRLEILVSHSWEEVSNYNFLKPPTPWIGQGKRTGGEEAHRVAHQQWRTPWAGEA